MQIQRRLLKSEEAAEFLGVSVWRLNDLRRRGRVPAVHLDRRTYRYDLAALEALAEGGGVTPGT